MHDLWATRHDPADDVVDGLWTEGGARVRSSRASGPDDVLSLWMKSRRPGAVDTLGCHLASLPVVPYRITAVCLGNICRSPVAEAVLRSRIAAAGLADDVVVDSAGTGSWHVGHGMDRRSRTLLDAHGYPHDHTVRRLDGSWLSGSTGPDLLLAMDEANYADLQRMVQRSGASATVRMVRAFDPALAALPEPDPRLDVPDPYYGGPDEFAAMLAMIEPAADGLVARLPSLIAR